MKPLSEQDPGALRDALVEQVEYLCHEIGALEGIIASVPERLLRDRPLPDMRSIKELYGLLATFDEAVYLPWLEAMTSDPGPAFETPEPPMDDAAWNERPVADILGIVRDNRAAVVDFLGKLPPEAWMRTAEIDGATTTVYELALRITQHDTDVLREVSQRLYESPMGRPSISSL